MEERIPTFREVLRAIARYLTRVEFSVPEDQLRVERVLCLVFSVPALSVLAIFLMIGAFDRVGVPPAEAPLGLYAAAVAGGGIAAYVLVKTAFGLFGLTDEERRSL